MSIKVALEHRTTYDFAHPVHVAPHVVRLRPAPHTRTPIEAYSLTVEPDNHFVNWQQDPFGNWMARLVFPEKVKTLDITVGLVADLMVINPFDFFVEEYAESYPFVYENSLHADLFPYLRSVDDAQAADTFRRDLPQAAGTSPGAPPQAIRLVLDRQGLAYLDDEPLADAPLAQRLAQRAQEQPDAEVQLRADAAVPYGRVVEVMGAAHAAGVKRIGFVAEPAASPDPSSR